MSGLKPNKFDDFNKILEIFDSCETLDQLKSVRYLSFNFRSKWSDLKLFRTCFNYYGRRFKDIAGGQL